MQPVNHSVAPCTPGFSRTLHPRVQSNPAPQGSVEPCTPEFSRTLYPRVQSHPVPQGSVAPCTPGFSRTLHPRVQSHPAPQGSVDSETQEASCDAVGPRGPEVAEGLVGAEARGDDTYLLP